MKASWLSCGLRSLIPQPLQSPDIVRPAALGLDPDFQVDLAAENLFHVEPSLGRDALELFAAGSDDHRLMPFLVDDDGGRDPAQSRPFLEVVDQYAAGI